MLNLIMLNIVAPDMRQTHALYTRTEREREREREREGDYYTIDPRPSSSNQGCLYQSSHYFAKRLSLPIHRS
jgi:hypothetical protein